jgi:hypothetical protein
MDDADWAATDDTDWAAHDPIALLARVGHNGGPPLDPEPVDPGASWRLWCWRRAHKRAWKTPPREIALRRLARAQELGMTYHAYTLEILERGIYL